MNPVNHSSRSHLLTLAPCPASQAPLIMDAGQVQCHIAGPNQDQPLRPVTCRDQTPPQPRILQPSLACCRCPKMERNGTEWYRIRKIRPFLPPVQPRILQPFLTCCRCPKMGRNGTEWYRNRKFRPFPPAGCKLLPIFAAAPTLARAARSSGIGEDAPYRWLQDRLFRRGLTRLRPDTADLARHELQGLMLRCLDMSTNYPTIAIPHR